MTKVINIVVPMAGKGSRFKDVGYTFPKPLIDINGKTMIERVIENLTPKLPHKFIFIVQKEHVEKYDLYNILRNATSNNFEMVQIDNLTEGAARTVLLAAKYINNEEELLIANSDQFIEYSIDDFICSARYKGADGFIMTFESSHPKWSYVKLDTNGMVVEVAEKKVISNLATVVIYYFKTGQSFVSGATSMILKNIRHNNEFYVCPVFNELILNNCNLYTDNISINQMHGLGTPEDLNIFLEFLKNKMDL